MYIPQATDLSTGGTAKVSASSGLSIFVVAVTNSDSSAQNVTFADDASLGILKIGANGSISLPCPIKCSSFTPGNAALSIVYYTARSQS
jgi:hypothetical protein